MAVVLALPPWPQDLVYHNFADTRAFFGIPNFWNVISNAAFLIVGVAGLRDDPLMAAGLILTAFGSGYYHWSPSSQTLFWDRLPMTIVFMAFYAAFLDDRLNIRRARWPLVILGVASVVWWRWTDDLRPYMMVQFFPIVSLPVLLYFCPASGSRPVVLGLVWYVAAKILEAGDAPLYATGMGGHALKHVAGAVGGWYLCRWFSRRSGMGA